MAVVYEGRSDYADVVISRDNQHLHIALDGRPSSEIDGDDPSALCFTYMAMMDAIVSVTHREKIRRENPGGRHLGSTKSTRRAKGSITQDAVMTRTDKAYAKPRGKNGDALKVLHLGGCACALARSWSVKYPSSRHVAVELDAKLIEIVRQHIGLPKKPALRIRHEDARHTIATMRPDTWDIIVRDVFVTTENGDASTPDELMNPQFYRQVTAGLRPGGVVLVNILGGKTGRAKQDIAAAMQIMREGGSADNNAQQAFATRHDPSENPSRSPSDIQRLMSDTCGGPRNNPFDNPGSQTIIDPLDVPEVPSDSCHPMNGTDSAPSIASNPHIGVDSQLVDDSGTGAAAVNQFVRNAGNNTEAHPGANSQIGTDPSNGDLQEGNRTASPAQPHNPLRPGLSVVAIAERGDFRSQHEHNVVLALSYGPIDVIHLRQELIARYLSCDILIGDKLEQWLGGARPLI
ncbi:MAG: fused MFS/spermidine synthase [Actinomycetaceae bacterium]|nr:fused MFS/spermidine synthase [Actinomycetaceae bacterium]